MKNDRLYFWVGLFLILSLSAFIYLSLYSSNARGFNPKERFDLKAYFRDVSGLGRNAKVTLSGVQIGKVKSIEIDPKHHYDALVLVEIDGRYQNLIPDDSSIEILTSGLLGEKYLGISLGGSEDYLKHQGEFSFTGSSIVLEKLIQQFVAQMGMKGDAR